MAEQVDPALETGVLAGLRVVELGRRIAGPVVGMVLAEQGAEVIRVVQQDQPEEDPVLAALLARGKTELGLDLESEQGRATLARLVRQADVLVENLAPGRVQALGLDLEALRAGGNPGLISCSIPGFAPGDPREDLPDYESIVGTAGYLYTKPIGAPWVHPFPLGSVLAGLFAANAVLAGLIARLRLGRGQHVGATLYHSDIFAQILLVLMKTGMPRGFLPLKMVGTPFMGSWLCGDDRYIYLHITLPAHNARILEVLEDNGHTEPVARLREVLSEDTMRDPSQVKSIPEAKKIKEIYEEIFLSRPAEQWEEILGEELCCIKVRTVQEWLHDSVEAGMADACTVDDPLFGELMATGAAVTVQEHPPRLRARLLASDDGDALAARWERAPLQLPEPLEESLDHPLQGIRVLDLSRIIAGPCAARILAELGAEVLSVQSPGALDWALSFHLLFNAGKRSVTLDFSDDEGKRRLWALMEDFQPHAFIQNYRHIQLARTIGVGPEQLRQRFPSIAYTHLNAYGNLGVWRDRPGFEQVVQAVSGIQVTYGRGGRPKLLPTPVIDIGSGLLGAFSTLLGLYQQKKAGQSVFASTHLTRMAVLFQVGPIADYQRQACLDAARRRGVEVQQAPDQAIIGGILRARDAFFCLAGPRRQLAEFLEAEGLARPGAEEPFDRLSRKVMMRTMAHWQKRIAAAGLADRLVTMRVPAMSGMVDDIPTLDPSPEPLVSRRDHAGVPSPLTFIRNPIRMSLTPPVLVPTAPMYGGDTREVLARVGMQLPEGHGVTDYPESKPLLVWLGTVLRWGYFAWRSGNV